MLGSIVFFSPLFSSSRKGLNYLHVRSFALPLATEEGCVHPNHGLINPFRVGVLNVRLHTNH